MKKELKKFSVGLGRDFTHAYAIGIADMNGFTTEKIMLDLRANTVTILMTKEGAKQTVVYPQNLYWVYEE